MVEPIASTLAAGGRGEQKVFEISHVCRNQSLGGFGHHGIYEQGMLTEAPIGSPREALVVSYNVQ